MRRVIASEAKQSKRPNGLLRRFAPHKDDASRLLNRCQSVPNRQQLQRKSLLQQSPKSLRQEQRKQQRRRAEPDEVPDARRTEKRLDQEEQHRPEDRPFEGAEAADQDHEDHIGGPLHAEIGLRLESQEAREPERAGHGGAGGGKDEEDAFGGQ